MELRLEVDAASWVAIVVELNPLFSGTVLGEELEGNLSLGDVVALVGVSVVDVNLEVVMDKTSVDLHVLSVPLGVLATILADG